MRFGFLLLAGILVAQDYSEIQVEKVVGGQKWLDGPLWSNPVRGVLFCDPPTSRILAWMPGKGTGVYKEQMEGASGLAYDNEMRLLVAQGRGRKVIRLSGPQDNKLEVLAERYEGKRFNGPNDITVRKDGQIYFTDPAFGYQRDAMELDFQGVFHLTPKGELNLVAKLKGRPAGVALSPNGRTLYVSSADEHRVYAFDVDGRGKTTNERIFVDQVEGVPGGLKTDEKGNVYLAANHVEIYTPAGKPLHRIVMGDKPSNLAFGEAEFMTLFITAKANVYRVKLKVKGAFAESTNSN